jgi:hypothetical protein
MLIRLKYDYFSKALPRARSVPERRTTKRNVSFLSHERQLASGGEWPAGDGSPNQPWRTNIVIRQKVAEPASPLVRALARDVAGTQAIVPSMVPPAVLVRRPYYLVLAPRLARRSAPIRRLMQCPCIADRGELAPRRAVMSRAASIGIPGCAATRNVAGTPHVRSMRESFRVE